MLKDQELLESTLQSLGLERAMLKDYHHTLIKELYDRGMWKRGIGRSLGVDIKTVRRHLKKEGWTPYPPRSGQERGKLSAFLLEWLKNRMAEVGYNAKILHRELMSQGQEVSYETVKRYVQPHRPPVSKGCVRYETGPGEQSQVDWGSAWVWIKDRETKVHFFTLVLGYSRRLYAQGFFDEKFSSLIQGHEGAFAWFGGLTEEILYDNPKTMISVHNTQTGDLVLNGAFKDFSDYYGFEPRFCRPYRPQTKGKIESGVKYLKRNFLPGRCFESLDHLNRELQKWICETADERIHGTTHQKPSERFKEENLRPIPRQRPYVYSPALQRKVSQDSMISFSSNRYSVPWKYVGQCVDVRLEKTQLIMSYEGEIVATHLLVQGKHQQRVCPKHYAGLVGGRPPKKRARPQYDPAWSVHETDHVPVRDLAIYEAFCLESFQDGLSW